MLCQDIPSPPTTTAHPSPLPHDPPRGWLPWAVGAACVLLLLRTMASSDPPAPAALAPAAPAPSFYLLVTCTFTAPEHLQQFLVDFQPLADHCRNEAGTLAYDLIFSDKDPLQVLILERYADKERDFVEVHRNSAPFLEFRPKLRALQDAGFVAVEGWSGLDRGVGFGSRP